MKRLIVLVHGFDKNHRDMRFLETSFKNAGFEVVNPKLPTRFSSLEDCVKALNSKVGDLLKNYDEANFVAHSMGGLIVRRFISKYPQKNIGNSVFISTPHHGSRQPEVLSKIPFTSLIWKPLKDLRTDLKYEPLTGVKLGVIAGNRNSLFWGRVILSKESDGRVEVESAKSDDMAEFIVLSYNHKKIHFQKETFDKVLNFIKSGRF